MTASGSRRWTGFESRPSSSESAPDERSEARFGVSPGVFRDLREVCDPCPARVFADWCGFESRPQRSTKLCNLVSLAWRFKRDGESDERLVLPAELLGEDRHVSQDGFEEHCCVIDRIRRKHIWLSRQKIDL